MFIYNTGENHWDRFDAWPLACDTRLRGAADAALSDRRLRPVVHRARRRRDRAATAYDEYVSDPAKPVPYLPRPVALCRRRRLAHVAGDAISASSPIDRTC